MAGKAIAVIHARGGSKRIPLKNIKEVGGQPLMAYPIQLCQACSWIERVIVSTDHDEIARIAEAFGAEVPFRRPADISEDVPSELVTEHALKFLQESEGGLPDYVLTTTPATPMTRSESLDEAYRLMEANPEWDAATMIRKAREFPEWMLRRDAETGEMSTVLGNPLDGEYNVSQNLPEVFYPAGAFWLNRVERFLESPSLYGRRWGGVPVDPESMVDIDEPEDLAEARQKMERQKS